MPPWFCIYMAPAQPYLRMSDRVVILLFKSINAFALDEEEKKELDEWIVQSPFNRSLFEEIMNQENLEKELKDLLRVEDERNCF
jgi:hypothetical protein